MPDWLEIIKAGSAIVGVASVLVGGVFGLRTYRRNLKLKRAEWLEKLHAKFFESANYKRIRRILDYQSEPDFSNLQTCNRHKAADDELCESFVDYLNFFEFIASLWRLGQLEKQEVLMLFRYYFELLRKRDFAWQFICERDFENLKALVDEIPAVSLRKV